MVSECRLRTREHHLICAECGVSPCRDAALMRSLKGPPLLAAIELLEVTSDKSEGGDDLFDAVWRVLCSGQALLLQQVLCHCHIA